MKDYVDAGVMSWSGSTPMEHNLLQIVDPYEYRQRFTMPKYLVNAAGDQFFHPASSRFYFDDLPGPKYLWYVANASHALDERFLEVFGSGFAWASNVINGKASAFHLGDACGRPHCADRHRSRRQTSSCGRRRIQWPRLPHRIDRSGVEELHGYQLGQLG